MARRGVRLNRGAFDRYVRAQVEARAQAALRAYQAFPRELDSPDNPFEPSPGPRRHTVSRTTTGVRIEVQSPGAEFLEHGNGDEPITGNPLLWLLLKRAGAQNLSPGARAFVRTGKDGRDYLVIREVQPYEGRNLLWRSVAIAFGLRV